MTLNCRHSKKNIQYDPRSEPYLTRIGLLQLTSCVDMTPDPELITALVERWRPETNTFHLYYGEATITVDDVHFLTNLSVDGEPVESEMRLPNEILALQEYVESLLGRKLVISNMSIGRVKMTWLRSHFDTIWETPTMSLLNSTVVPTFWTSSAAASSLIAG
ncbi:Serine/threonine-protein phosphatase 7 long form homolog [Linum perenne]